MKFADVACSPATVIPLPPGEAKSAIMAYPGITNAAQTASAVSVIANQETDKYTDFFGVGWQTYPGQAPFTTAVVDVNFADLGKPPPAASYYLGEAGQFCMFPQYGGYGVFPEGMPCNTIYDGYYSPLVQVGSAARHFQTAWASCTLNFG